RDTAGNLAVSANATFTTLAVVVPTPAPTPAGKKNRKPIGHLDGVKADGTVFGWALDPDSPAQSVPIHFYLNSPAGSPNTTPIGTNASQQRSDIGSHAFNFKVPDSYFDGNTHKVYVYAIDLTDTSGASNRLVLGAPLSFVLASPTTPVVPSTTPPIVPTSTPPTTTPSTTPVATSSPTSTVPSPLAYWTFDSTDISGGSASDKSGNSISLNANNISSIIGKVGQALSFNGTNSNLQAYNNLLNLNSDMSFSFWIKTATTKTEAILSKYDSSGSESGYMLKINNGNLEMQIGNANLAVYGGRLSTDTKKINDSTWHHVTVVINLGKDVRFYIDGSLSSIGNSVTKTSPLSSPFQIGSEPFGYYGAYFNGSLDEVRVYPQSLSQAEIQAILALGMGQVKGEYVNANITETGAGLIGESGKLYQVEGSKTIYLILSDNTKYAFRSAAEFNNFGYKFSLVIKVPNRAKEWFFSTFADSILTKLQSHPNGTFVKYAGKPAVYLIDNGYKRAVPSAEVLKQYTDFTHVLTIPKAFVYADGIVLK
ncbi:MAG: LamG domain-containing protein, partial [Patescibacteria group bacterium]